MSGSKGRSSPLRAMMISPGIDFFLFFLDCIYDDCASLEVSFDVSGVGPLFCMNTAV